MKDRPLSDDELRVLRERLADFAHRAGFDSWEELESWYIPTADLAPLVDKHGIDPGQLVWEVRQQVADAVLRDRIRIAKENRKNASNPRQARVPDSVGEELQTLITTMTRPDAIKALAKKYRVGPPAIRQKLRNVT